MIFLTKSNEEEIALVTRPLVGIRSRGRSAVNKTFASVAKADLVFASLPVSKCDIQVMQGQLY